jgi:hypothetical protein
MRDCFALLAMTAKKYTRTLARVIPTQAGIHTVFVISTAKWIPAFAGMTHRDVSLSKPNAAKTRMDIASQPCMACEAS